MPPPRRPRARARRTTVGKGPRKAAQRRATARPRPARGLELEKLVGLPQYKMPVLSHDRQKVAFYWDATGRNELYVADLSRPKPRQVSHGEAPRALRTWPLWDRQGESIFFGKDAQGNENHDLYRIWLKDGRTERLTEDTTSEKHPLDVSPDGRWLLWAGNAAGKQGRRQVNLWRLDLRGGSRSEQLTDHANPVMFWAIWTHGLYSPDGRWVAYTCNELPDPANLDVYRVASDGGAPERVLRVKEGSKDEVAGWSPDGRSLTVDSDATGNYRPGILDLGTRKVRWFGHEGWEETAEDISPDGRQLLTLGRSGVATKGWTRDLSTGGERELDLPGGTCALARFAPLAGKLLWYGTDVDQPLHFRALDLKTQRSQVLLPPLLPEADRKQLAPCETVRYRSFDGREVEALLFRPRHPRPGRSNPALVEVHGGPTGQFFRQFNPVAQYLASLGFTVLEPNIRGSTGYGVEFRDIAKKDWGGADLEDVVQGADHLRTLPHVDPKRVGIFGGSYGGFMTYLATVKHPEAWKAACSIVGITDLHLMWDKSKEHFRYFLREQMGDPVEDASLWKDRSAVHFAENLHAKILMLHGANDPRCPVDQARVFRDRLVEFGKMEGRDFEYVEYADEGHGSDDIRQKLRMWRRMGEFFQREL